MNHSKRDAFQVVAAELPDVADLDVANLIVTNVNSLNDASLDQFPIEKRSLDSERETKT